MNQRVIKFRAWDLDNGNMWHSDRDEESGEGPIIWLIDKQGPYFEEPYVDVPESSRMEYHRPNQIVMGCTGWLDKNGVDIYEGDLLEIRFSEKVGEDTREVHAIYSVKLTLEGMEFTMRRLFEPDEDLCSSHLGQQDICSDCANAKYSNLAIQYAELPKIRYERHYSSNIVMVGNEHENPELIADAEPDAAKTR